MIAHLRVRWLFPLLALLLFAACTGSDNDAGDDWPVYGRTTDELHFSPLAQISAETVSNLGLAWFADLDTPWSSSAPVEADGVLYVAVGLSHVHAFEVETGSLLWSFDPKVSETDNKIRLQAPQWGIRGLAYAEGRIHVATVDGRLIALKARDGTLLWQVQTLEPGADSSYITGPPRVFDGKVIVGFGGADIGVTRGYVTAYDAKTGEKLWRFWTVPGNPADGFENAAMERAATTWTGKWWRFGGGGTVWNAITYDEKFDRIYIGTGNGLPWNRKIRSPEGGDNLYLCSIVALDADTGDYVWHYQTTPGDTWDFNASMDMELTDLTIDGEEIPVLLQAPKNGFFYVIDRRDGRLLSATPFSEVTWADGVDMQTGRPREADNARYERGPRLVYPGAAGAHSWLPMSFNPRTRLTYIPEIILPASYADIENLRSFAPQPGINSSTGVDFNAALAPPHSLRIAGALVAWDAARGEPAWRVETETPFNGGAISTAGNLVFQGQANGHFYAYAADSGDVLWNFDASAPLVSPPITYAHNGKQYVTILTGIAGAAGVAGEMNTQFGWHFRSYSRRVLTFALGGRTELPPRSDAPPVVAFDDPSYRRNARLAQRGAVVYFTLSCAACHGPLAVAGGTAPDLRASPIVADANAFQDIVQHGALAARGMPMFNNMPSADLAALRQYLRSRAAELRQAQLSHD